MSFPLNFCSFFVAEAPLSLGAENLGGFLFHFSSHDLSSKAATLICGRYWETLLMIRGRTQATGQTNPIFSGEALGGDGFAIKPNLLYDRGWFGANCVKRERGNEDYR